MRTINNLLSLEGRIYVWLEDEEIQRRFMQDAEAEGFTFGEDRLPTRMPLDSIVALNINHTLNYVGIIGHMAFDHPTHVSGQKLIRVDYEKYIAGDDDYLILY